MPSSADLRQANRDVRDFPLTDHNVAGATRIAGCQCVDAFNLEMCSNNNPQGPDRVFGCALIVQAMFTEYRPTHGYDEYFNEQSAPRADLEPLLSPSAPWGWRAEPQSCLRKQLLRASVPPSASTDQGCMVSGSCPSIHCRDSFTARNGPFWSADWCNVWRLLISFWQTFMGPNGSSTTA